MSDTLPKPASSASATTAVMSLARALQLNTTLEEAFATLHGYGVVSGGLLANPSGLTVRVPTGTVLFAEGKVLTTSANTDYNSLTPSATNYLWGKVTRGNGGDSTPTAEDTYTLTLTHNTTGTAPSSSHFLLGVIIAGASTVSSINNAPATKFLRFTNPLWSGKISIPAASGATIAADEQWVGIKLTISGYLTVAGLARFG